MGGAGVSPAVLHRDGNAQIAGGTPAPLTHAPCVRSYDDEVYAASVVRNPGQFRPETNLPTTRRTRRLPGPSRDAILGRLSPGARTGPPQAGTPGPQQVDSTARRSRNQTQLQRLKTGCKETLIWPG